MAEMNHQTVGLNVMSELVVKENLQQCTRIPVKEGTGEILLYIDTEGGGDVYIQGGNTVFGGKQRVFDLPDTTKYLIRLEVGPHLIKDESGCYIAMSTNLNGFAAAIELH